MGGESVGTPLMIYGLLGRVEVGREVNLSLTIYGFTSGDKSSR
jgi:hypothetical protein